GDIYTGRRAPGDPLICPTPVLNPAPTRDNQQVWFWEHNPNTPAKVTGITALVSAMGGMQMPVCTRIEVESVLVRIPERDELVELPLTSPYVLTKFMIASGKVGESDHGWWQLPAEIDPSLLVVFGYQLTSVGGKPKPIDFAVTNSPCFFPDPKVDDPHDPDATDTDPGNSLVYGSVRAAAGETKICYVTPRVVIVAFSLTTCREATDFFPGKLLGTARIYPHVMVTSNIPMIRVETKVVVDRPPTTQKHSPVKPDDVGMQDDIGAIFFADTNTVRAWYADVDLEKAPPPLPLWNNFFDYYDLKPPIGQPILCVDKSKPMRHVERSILRQNASGAYDAEPFTKLARQGAYDNLHLAPKMTLRRKDGVEDPIAMAPFCVHDCLHTHFRWGIIAPKPPKIIYGFEGRKPYAKAGAPLVPANQNVWITLKNASSFYYHAIAEGPAEPATWNVFFHHGMAYLLSVADPFNVGLARNGVAALARARWEPFTGVGLAVVPPLPIPVPLPAVVPEPVLKDIDPTSSWAAFYWRLQFGGSTNPLTGVSAIAPRIQILDPVNCRDT
ncbi:MAG TPA: hypothetical protein VNO21_22230, partial [Polyangiaceae bacterium]|nr:hypothetical protein [Polyangiaceae bacterium]